MKVILDLDDEVYKVISTVAENEDITISEVVEKLVNRNYIEPSKRYVAFEKSDLKDEFRSLIKQYFHEDLESLYDVIGSEEESPYDKDMLEVYKYLYQDVVAKNGVFLELFEVYKKSKRAT